MQRTHHGRAARELGTRAASMSRPAWPKPPCRVEGCSTASNGRSGLCTKHRARFDRYGTTDLRRPPRTAAEAFAAGTPSRPVDGCWEWVGSRHVPSGYGRFGAGGLPFYAHRYALELKLGRSIGAGLDSLHTCDNPPCCNPAHLFEGTAKDNSADARAKGRLSTGDRHRAARAKTRKPTCPQGHPREGQGGRCMVCYRAWRRKNYARYNRKYRDPNYQKATVLSHHHTL